jgi:hypothetical protein
VHEHVLKPLFSVPAPRSLLLFVFNLAVDCRFDHALAMKIFVFGLLSLPMSFWVKAVLPRQPLYLRRWRAEVERLLTS